MKKHVTWNTKCILCLIPSLAGTLIFFAVPYIRILYYSIIDNQFRRNFVGLDNYLKTLGSEYFQLALKNSMLIILFCIPIITILSIVISLMLTYGIELIKSTRTVFILPMLIPAASIILIWRRIFTNTATPLPIYLLFLWKNIGICIILLTAAFTSIGSSIYEAARIDGANTIKLHLKVTIPMIAPSIFFTILLSIINSFKVFKESYLFFGSNYPPNHSYTLQYYMNNNFLKLDYQSLATGAVLTSVLVFVIVVCGLLVQRRYSQ